MSEYLFKKNDMQRKHFNFEGKHLYNSEMSINVLRSLVKKRNFFKPRKKKIKKEEYNVDLSNYKDPEKFEDGVPVEEFIKHNKPYDAWISINGYVYDITRYA